MADDSQWRTPGFRQSVVQKINEAILASGSNSARNPMDMENHVFQKARNKDEYLGFVARLILHVREMNAKNKTAQGNGDVPNPGGNTSVPDPINALQNMTSPGGRSAQMMGMPGGPGPVAGNMGVGGNIPASNLLQTLTQLRPGTQNPQQQQLPTSINRGGPLQMPGNQMPGSMQNPGGIVGGNVNPNAANQMAGNMNPSNMNMGMAGNQINQMAGLQQTNQLPGGIGNQMGQMGNQMNMNANSLPGGNNQMGGMGNMNQMGLQNSMVNQMNMNQNQLNPTQMANSMNVGGVVGPINQVNQNQINQINNTQNQIAMGGQGQQTPSQMSGLNSQSGITPQNPMASGPVTSQMNPTQMMNMQQTMGRKPQEMMMNSPSSVFQGVRNVTPNQFLRQSPSPSVPSPVAMNQNIPGNSMVPSPALVPSPSPQMPGSMMGPQRSVGSVMAPSPSSCINTPQQANAVPSPLNPQEEQLYREKYRQLTKYIEPLKRMIARMGNDDVEKLLKMNRLLEILCNPSKRIPLETLVKCEKALEKMDFKSNVALPLKEHQTNNPLLEAVSSAIQSQLGNHTLQRTFRPCLEALFGPDIKNLPPPEKRPRMSSDEYSQHTGPVIPHTMQGEIARLDQKFKVSLDTSSQPGTKTIKLICCLDDKHLPCVPPVTVSIPEDYPLSAPNCNLIEHEYSASPFLASVQKALSSRISKLPRQYSLSHLLDTWEMSVRQACSPNAFNTTEQTVIMGI